LFIVDEKLRDEPTGAILKVWKKNKVVVILKEIVLFLKGNLTWPFDILFSFLS
jgi:hypothetical protein